MASLVTAAPTLVTMVRGWWSNVLWTGQFELTWDRESLVTVALTLVTMVRGWWSNVLWTGQFQLTWDMAWHNLWRHCWWPWWDAGDHMFYELDSFNSHETWHRWWWRCWWPWWEAGDKETGAAEDCRLHLASASSPEMPTQPFEHPLFYHQRHAPVIH